MKYLLIIAISTLIGWITNKIAIILLLKPYKQIKYLGWFGQGVIPRSKYKLAINVADIIKKKILTNDKIKNKLFLLFPFMETLNFVNEGFFDEIVENLDVRNIAVKSINEFDNEEIEKIVKQAANEYLVHLEILGAILGFFIGIIECFII